ncbi:MAG: hypothetical protein ACXW4O_17635, partial [Candidatus Binatia bacterium]
MLSIEPSRRELNGAGDVSDVALEQQASRSAIMDRTRVLAPFLQSHVQPALISAFGDIPFFST